MRYLILIWRGSRPFDAERWRSYAALNESLISSGELVISEALADPPLAGFHLVDCDGHERAMEIAAQVPESSLGLVEVRPTLAMNSPDV